MNLFELSYTVHVSCVVLSGSLFFIRGIWMMQNSYLLQLKPTKVVPHVIDTVLLLSALSLTLQIHQYPFVDSWLTVKVVALIAYILLGIAALRPGPKKRKIGCYLAALLTFAFMVSVALTRNPTGIFSLFD